MERPTGDTCDTPRKCYIPPHDDSKPNPNPNPNPQYTLEQLNILLTQLQAQSQSQNQNQAHAQNQAAREAPKGKHSGEYSCELFIALGWTIAFWIEVGKTNSTDCQGPTWIWSLYAKIYYLVSTVLCFLGMTVFRPVILRSTNPGIVFFVFVFSVLYALVRLAGIALTVGMIISFANIDDCSDLHGIILAQFIFIMIGFGSVALICCCTCVGVCCAVGGESANGFSSLIRSLTVRLFGFHGYQQPKQAAMERDIATQV